MNTSSEATLRAITFMKVRLDTPDRRHNAMSDLMLDQAFNDDAEMALMLNGLTNLVTHLLVRLERPPRQPCRKPWTTSRSDISSRPAVGGT